MHLRNSRSHIHPGTAPGIRIADGSHDHPLEPVGDRWQNTPPLHSEGFAIQHYVYGPQFARMKRTGMMVGETSMSQMTYTTLRASPAELYRTTPFEVDSSAASLSQSVVVTTTIVEPTGNWAGSGGPVASTPETPESVPFSDKAPISD